MTEYLVINGILSKYTCFAFCNAFSKSDLSPAKEESTLLTPQPTLPHKRVTLGKFCLDFEIDAKVAKPDKDNADANEAIEAKADKTVKAN
jgi:hypothetical protein